MLATCWSTHAPTICCLRLICILLCCLKSVLIHLRVVLLLLLLIVCHWHRSHSHPGSRIHPSHSRIHISPIHHWVHPCLVLLCHHLLNHHLLLLLHQHSLLLRLTRVHPLRACIERIAKVRYESIFKVNNQMRVNYFGLLSCCYYCCGPADGIYCWVLVID